MRISREGLHVVRLVMLLLLGSAFAVFVTAAGFAPGLFAAPVVAGGAVSGWFVFGLGLIWAVVLMTGAYVVLANAADGT